MPTCTRCGEFVTSDFARVFGDNHDTVHGCPSCTSLRDLTDAVREGTVSG